MKKNVVGVGNQFVAYEKNVKRKVLFWARREKAMRCGYGSVLLFFVGNNS
jgi:hypothetical protein